MAQHLFLVGFLFGLLAVLWISWNMLIYGTIFFPAKYLWYKAEKNAVKVVAPLFWGIGMDPGGKHHGGYDYFTTPLWWWWNESSVRFKIKNRTDKPLEVSWAPYGGGDPRTPYFGTVVVPAKSSVTVRCQVWYHGIAFFAHEAKD
jgi:hypothetical protein